MIMKTSRNPKIIPCTLVGDGMVGKTTLALTFVNNRLPDGVYVATVFDNFAGNLSMHGEQFTISIFDSPGQHDYEDVRAFTYGDSEVVIICYNVTDKDSFQNVRDVWVPEVRRHTRRKMPVILVGCQTDKRVADDSGHVSNTEGSDLSKEIGANMFMECSTSLENCATELFESMANLALKNRKRKTNILNRILRR